MDVSECLTTSQAAAYTMTLDGNGVSVDTIRRWVRDGRLPVVYRLNDIALLDPSEVERIYKSMAKNRRESRDA